MRKRPFEGLRREATVLSYMGNYVTEELGEAGWLMFHSVGRFAGQRAAIQSALAGFASDWSALDQNRWAAADAGRQRTLGLWAELIRAPLEDVFCAENVTAAFHTFLTALDPSVLAGRRVLIAADCFPSLHFLLSGLAPRLGFTLVTVPLRGGSAWVEDDDFIRAWGRDVALALVTWVTSTASRIANLDRLIAHGRIMQSLIAVDATQGVGILPFDIAGIDFAASTSLKWLCGVPGAGMAYVSPQLSARLQPTLRGWFSQPDPFNWDIEQFSFAAFARRFDHGTPSFLPFIASEPGLLHLRDNGIDSIRRHNLTLSRVLLEIADSHGLEVVSPRLDAERGGTVVIRVPDAIAPAELAQQLGKSSIHCDVRGNRMRWSPGLITKVAALHELDRCLGEALV
jgi:kynureninase